MKRFLYTVCTLLLCFCTDTAVGIPDLIYPINGEQVTPPLTFIWSSVDNSPFYRIEVDRTLSFSTPVIVQDVNDTSYTTTALSNDIHFWRVAAYDNDLKIGAYADPQSFQVVMGGAPQNLSLATANAGQRVLLSWEEPLDGQPDNYLIYFREVNTTDWIEQAELDGDVLTYTHDPLEMTGDYYVAADFAGVEFISGTLTTIPVETATMTLGELNAVDFAGYGWDITTDFMGSTFSMIESANIPLVDFYLSNWDGGIALTPYGIWAPDQAATDPGNLGGVPVGAWRTTAIGNTLITNPQVPLPEYTTLNYATYVDMNSFPAYVAIYTVDGYYALLHVPTPPNTINGTVDVESWFQTVEGLRLIAH